MAFWDDFTLDFATGNIRHTSGSTVYSVLTSHEQLQDRSDDLDGADNDPPSVIAGKRDATKPTVLTLPDDGPETTEYNIDDNASQYLNFGSIEQKGGDELYTGLKTLGAIVAASPMYIVQNLLKLTKFWPDGHVQILVKAKNAGSLIDSGDVIVFSRKYGQSFSTFDANLAAGSEQVAAIGTELDTAISLSEGAAITVFGNLTITIGDINRDIGDVNGSKLYKGEIDVNGERLSDVYQALMAATSENSVQTINSIPGWRYRKLNAAYAENAKNPFGPFSGGKFLVAQGWWLTGVHPDDANAYELISDDGTSGIKAPTTTGQAFGNLIVGDRIMCAESATPGGPILKSKYTLAAGNNSGNGTLVIKETIDGDRPAAGIVRIDDDEYAYSSFSGSTFTLTGTLSQNYAEDAGCYVPFISKVAAAATESVSFPYVTDRPIGGWIKNGTGPNAIVSFPISGTIGESSGTINVVRQSEV